MSLTQHLRVLEPAPGILAFYDGRVAGQRFAVGPNWVDDGALSLGVASYAVISGDQALVYDTHVSVPHALAIRGELTARGVRDITVVLSHWHLDHVAGTAAFADCEVIANRRTLGHLTRRKAGIEAGTDHGLPAIAPLILPNRLFSGQLDMMLGARPVSLIEANIHSDDATVLWLPEERVLLAGDTMEDCVTYVGEPEHFATHLADLDRLAALKPAAILPNHGSPEVIAAGGYGPELIPATQRYIRLLMGLRDGPQSEGIPLEQAIAGDLQSGTLRFFAPYRAVHAGNLSKVAAFYRDN